MEDDFTKFADIARNIADIGWGRAESKSDAARYVVGQGIRLEGVCLVALVETLEDVITGLTSKLIERKLRLFFEAAWKRREAWVTEEQRKHGPMPDVLSGHYHDDWHRAVGGYLARRNSLEEVIREGFYWFPRHPPKGSAAHKEYDRWRKRKAKAKSDAPTT